MLTEKHEEILEAIWAAGENKQFSLDAVKNRCAMEFTEFDLKEMEQQNLIVLNADKILFSALGKGHAELVIRRHRLAEVLVNSILQLKNTEMEEIACKMEHSLIPEVEESICILLGHPEICPDGKDIPKGKCCNRGQSNVTNTVVPLSALKPGESGKITFIKPASHDNLHRLLSLGLQPGVQVLVHAISPAYCVKFDNIELALDKDLADNIFVWKVNKPG
jgi:DtxR family transcriptional regulator, Mn-dependent transcriptional regulator